MRAIPFGDDLQRLAEALTAGSDRLHDLEAVAADTDLLERNRVLPAVARRLRGLGRGGRSPELLRARFFRAAARVALLTQTLQSVGDALGSRGIAWAPIKGGDLAFRAYEHPEDRDFGDLDVLVAEHDRERATAALEDAGWLAALAPSEATEAFLRDEHYCASFSHPLGVLLELHHRLWGAVPTGLAEEVIQSTTPDPALAPTGRRISPAHAFVIAGVHVWMVSRPRALSNWWDLQRLAVRYPDGLGDDVAAVARRWELQLPVGLAALASASLWPDEPALVAIADDLLDDLRPSERVVVARCVRKGVDAVPFWSVVLARLLAGRPSRHGWRSVWRRLQPHPALRAQRRAGRNRERP